MPVGFGVGSWGIFIVCNLVCVGWSIYIGMKGGCSNVDELNVGKEMPSEENSGTVSFELQRSVTSGDHQVINFGDARPSPPEKCVAGEPVCVPETLDKNQMDGNQMDELTFDDMSVVALDEMAHFDEVCIENGTKDRPTSSSAQLPVLLCAVCHWGVSTSSTECEQCGTAVPIAKKRSARVRPSKHTSPPHETLSPADQRAEYEHQRAMASLRKKKGGLNTEQLKALKQQKTTREPICLQETLGENQMDEMTFDDASVIALDAVEPFEACAENNTIDGANPSARGRQSKHRKSKKHSKSKTKSPHGVVEVSNPQLIIIL